MDLVTFYFSLSLLLSFSLSFSLLFFFFSYSLLGTCVPICFAAFLLRILMFSDHFYRPYLIFIESFCRVKSLSLTGKLLYYFVDKFIVQWENLQIKYSKAEYIGKIC